MIKFGAITGSLGNLGDRYAKSYKDEISFKEKLAKLKGIRLLDGIEISQDEIKGMDSETVKGLVKSSGMEISAIGIDLTSPPQYRFGSITNADPLIRKESVDKLKKTMDFAQNIGVGLLNLWLGQDGFDYPLQTDYARQWQYAVDALKECADYCPEIQIALESKPREPRNRCFLDSTATSLLVAMDTDKANVGLTIDVGHVLQDGRNMTQAIAIANAHGKLFNLHINDNYANWDDDMIVGSVHTVEFIEMFYFLEKIGYDKWCTVDIFPFRECAMAAVEESLLHMEKFRGLVGVIGIGKLDECIEKDDARASLKHIRENIFI